MERKYLPIGRQAYRNLQEDNCVYVDKTQYIHRLCTEGKTYFMSRPRRFGKSLLLSTMEELFKGGKDVFTNTWIYDKWDWSKKNPVIHISFLSVPYETHGLEKGLEYMLFSFYEEYDLIPSEGANIKLLFSELIEKLYQKEGQVVVLIDEYDKAIIDYLEENQMDKAKENQLILGLFYGALKDAEKYIRLLFITGISKFTKVSLFSKLNNLDDITLNAKYATMLGYTQQEFESYFEDYISEIVAIFSDYTREAFLAEIKLWYNGYSWDGKTTLYNPFGILLFLNNQDFQSFWFASGTPTFLTKKLEQQNFYRLENIETDINFLDKYSLDNLDLTSLLFQTGYLTIKEKSRNGELVLSYPNKEVQTATYAFMIDDMGYTNGSGGGVTVKHLRKAFLAHDLEWVKNILTSLFSGLAYDVYMHQTMPQIEGFYHGLVHILFKCLGIYVQSEVHTSNGRADIIVQTDTHIYFLEFKINKDADTAFQQIIDKQYAAPFGADKREKIGIGINFSTDSRSLNDWKSAVLW